jgi:large subunit ribosomal protein L15
MLLNTLRPAPGSRPARKRLGRGIGSTLGKTCGKGHKGQKARAGGFRKVGFEGGQMPLQRRLPKVGFKSRAKAFSAEIRLGELSLISAEAVTLESLREAGVIAASIKRAKIIDSGSVGRAFHIRGVQATAGAKVKIEAAGGSVEG